MAPKKASTKKNSPQRAPPAQPSSAKKRGRGRPAGSSSKSTQVAAEERAEQETAGGPATRTTRSATSPAKTTSAKTPVSNRKITKKSSVKPKNTATKSRPRTKITQGPGYAESADDGEQQVDALDTTESASPGPPKQKECTVNRPKGHTPNPFDRAPDLSPPKASRTQSSPAAFKKLLKTINDAAYDAMLVEGIRGLAAYKDLPSESRVSKEVFDTQQALGVKRAVEEWARIEARQSGLNAHGTNSGQSQVKPTPNTSSQRQRQASPRKTNAPEITNTRDGTSPRKVLARTPEPTHVDARKQADDERRKLLSERRKVLANAEACSSTLASELQVPAVPKLSKRGHLISSTNPGVISIVVDKDKPHELQERANPFFETLPGPEIWHRNMPPFFSFGETKFMQQQISDEINHDLARPTTPAGTSADPASSTETTTGNIIETVMSPIRAARAGLNWMTGHALQPGPQTVPAAAGSSPDKTKVLRPDQWALPKLTHQEKADIRREIQRRFPGYKPPTTPPPSPKKRKASGQQSSLKRARGRQHHA